MSQGLLHQLGEGASKEERYFGGLEIIARPQFHTVVVLFFAEFTEFTPGKERTLKPQLEVSEAGVKKLR